MWSTWITHISLTGMLNDTVILEKSRAGCFANQAQKHHAPLPPHSWAFIPKTQTWRFTQTSLHELLRAAFLLSQKLKITQTPFNKQMVQEMVPHPNTSSVKRSKLLNSQQPVCMSRELLSGNKVPEMAKLNREQPGGLQRSDYGCRRAEDGRVCWYSVCQLQQCQDPGHDALP